MMNFTFKTVTGKITTVRACDKEQAQILAVVRYGKEFLKADLVKATNTL